MSFLFHMILVQLHNIRVDNLIAKIMYLAVVIISYIIKLYVYIFMSIVDSVAFACHCV